MIKSLFIVLFSIPVLLGAQLPNEWINYDQNYFKFPIAQNGVYRIDFQQLVNAGVNITSIDPRNIQIFAKGEELPIYIQGESDGSFDSNDFIEFYAEKNDGWYDHTLFSDSTHVSNPHVSMFTDTLYHFLTWNSSFSNLRMENQFDLNFNAYTPIDYFWKEELYLVHVDYEKPPKYPYFNPGNITSEGLPVPEYSEGEGFFISTVEPKKDETFTLQTPFKYSKGPNGWIKTEMCGLGPDTHYVQVSVNDSLVYDDYFVDQTNEYVENSVPVDCISGETKVKFNSVTPVENVNDKFVVSYVHLRYPREMNMGGESDMTMFIPAGSQSKDLLVLENYNNLNSTVRLYDVTNGKRIQVQPLSGKYYALVPNNGKEKKCYLTTEAAIRTVSSISPVNKGNSKFTNYKDIIDGKGGVDFLLLTSPELLDVGQEYCDYRELKGLKSLTADMNQLYDQFSFGIRKHPMSIRNYVDAIINDWNYDLTYLFLCGKSISHGSSSNPRNPRDKRKYWKYGRFTGRFEGNIVPTWSCIGSDVGFTQRLKPGSILDPVVATGRIAVNDEDQLRAYLRKVQDYESAEVSDWMKQALHFGGGSSEGEQQIFKGFLEEYEKVYEDSLFGGYVHTFLKNSSDPLQINLSDSVTNLINNGVSLMTFFGHAYGNNFDQSIDEPENYENTGRYPFIIANSCLIGNIHTSGTSSGSERFVLAEDKGAIGFLGSSSLGVPPHLYNYSLSFYENFSKDFYGWPVGKVVQQTIKATQDSVRPLNRDVSMHMTLHCDPAVVLNAHPKPDYTIYGNNFLTKTNVYFNPDIVSSELDSFSINLIVKNIGKAQGDTFDILISRNFPGDGVLDTTYSIEVSGLFYSDTISITLPVDKINGIGLNTFKIKIDAKDQVDELSELNNEVEVDLFINSSDIIPIYPYEFAVIPNSSTVLKASTGNPYAPLTKYFFQIDTSDAFNSPIMFEETMLSNGGVLEWNPANSSGLESFFNQFSSNTTIENPQVFFWRVSADSTGNNGFAWKESSFQHVTNKTGWGQAHFHQFKKDEFTFLDYDYSNRDVDFIEQFKSISAKTHIRNGGTETKYEIDGAIQAFMSSADRYFFFVAVIDRSTLKPWHSQEHGDRGHYNYGKLWSGVNDYNFYFENNNEKGIDSLMSFVKDVPDSNYILFYSFRGNNCQKWLTGKPISEEYESMFQEIGANVDSLKKYNTEWPYILFFKKGDTNSVVESFSPDGVGFIELDAQMKNNWINGYTNSTVVGPSSEWGSLHWELGSGEPGNIRDSARISVFGIDYDGNEVLLIDSITNSGDMLGLNDSINAQDYPYLRLSSFFADDSLRTPNSLLRWQVLYEEIPDAAINPLKVNGYTLIDSVQQGEELVFITAIENISNVAMDSIQVSYRIVDNEYNNFPFTYTLKKPIAPGEVIFDTITISTVNLIGNNNLWYEINPYVGPKPWQLEQHHFNNLYLHKFDVYGDDVNPVLDVTFDGVHIMNGDIVNPKPSIVITLDDENIYLELDDPDLITLYLKTPSIPEDSVPPIDPSTYSFIPANLPHNKCRIEFNGNFTEDGIYELRVRATDKSSNKSGNGDGVFDYRISFEVITESSITQLINYPNPFSTSTRFVFTLTGSELPDNILIQIMTITGKVVKEITMHELGPIKIGRNVTEYEWDGTDKYGDKLANGVYLYKVQIQKDGQVLKEREVTISTSEGTTTLSDKYFKKGLGKMYILR